MINHGYATDTFLQANMIPIPKGARANVTDSNMYRSIAISSIMSKILDNVIIEQQQFFYLHQHTNLVLNANHPQFYVLQWLWKLSNII